MKQEFLPNLIARVAYNYQSLTVVGLLRQLATKGEESDRI